MNIQMMETAKLKPYKKNAKKHPDEQVKWIANSIKQFGFQQPIVCDKDHEVIIGHGRLMAAKRLKIKEVPVVMADELTDEQVKALRLADNKTNESGWDTDLLTESLDEILNIDMTDFGFELDFDDLQEQEPEITEDETPDEVETRVKLGDVWKLGEHRLICGDSTNAEVIDKLMDGAKADMVLSDPPYGMKLDTDYSTIKSNMADTQGNKYSSVLGDNDDFSPELITTFFENFGYCEEMFLFGADYYAEILPDKNEGSWLVWDKRLESQKDGVGSEFELIWSRTRHKRRMLRHDWFGFLSSENGADARNRVHPTQKPVTLIADILKQWGSKAHNIVDLYGGSGSTLIACEKMEKRCFICELDEHYCDVIVARWETLTGRAAERLEE